MRKADRYTVLPTHLNDLPERIKALRNLDMYWFIGRPATANESTVDIYAFLDNAGQQNYLDGTYGKVADELKGILRRLDDQELTPEETLDLIKARLDY